MKKPWKKPELKFEASIVKASIVKAPICDECRTPMKAFDAYRWECPGCAPGVPVHVLNCYPFFATEFVKEGE